MEMEDERGGAPPIILWLYDKLFYLIHAHSDCSLLVSLLSLFPPVDVWIGLFGSMSGFVYHFLVSFDERL